MGRTRTRYNEPEILRILRDREGNHLSVRAICVKYGVTSSTYYRWRARHEGASLTAAGADTWRSDLAPIPRVPLVTGSPTAPARPVPGA